jgi:hypothetical protein
MKRQRPLVTATPNSFDAFREKLDHLLGSFQDNRETQVAWGNVRYELCEWSREGNRDCSVAIVYEVPGGSTSQINISYDAETGVFSYLSDDLTATTGSTDPRDALDHVAAHLRDIPAKRLARLEGLVDEWLAEGQTRTQILTSLQGLLDTDLVGGRVTPDELKRGIQYLMKRAAPPAG